MRNLLILVVGTLLAGCMPSAKSIATWKTEEVAKGYGDTVGNVLTDHAPYEAELRSRGVFTEAQWERIRRRVIQPGDPSLLVRAAWGTPDDAETTQTAAGTCTIWHYRFNTTRPEAQGYVVFRGDAVSSVTQ